MITFRALTGHFAVAGICAELTERNTIALTPPVLVTRDIVAAAEILSGRIGNVVHQDGLRPHRSVGRT